jgi:hypothetical protein
MLGGAFSTAVQAQGPQILDTDGDAIPDVFDNCLLVPQSPMTFADTNLDGFGNACDPDLDDDLLVDSTDLTIFAVTFGYSAPPAGAASDFDVDDVTGIPDAIILRAFFGGPPGPSGLSCAGTVPCQ